MRGLVFAAVLCLGGCAFSSERPLFSPSAAVFPFGDSAVVETIENVGDDIERFTFRRTSAGYAVTKADSEEEMTGVLFIPVRGTPEEDYIVQTPIEGRDSASVYAFMWRSGEGYRIIFDPHEFDADARARAWLGAHCRRLSLGECQLDQAAELRQFARLHARALARNLRTPQHFMTLTVVEGARAARSKS